MCIALDETCFVFNKKRTDIFLILPQNICCGTHFLPKVFQMSTHNIPHSHIFVHSHVIVHPSILIQENSQHFKVSLQVNSS